MANYWAWTEVDPLQNIVGTVPPQYNGSLPTYHYCTLCLPPIWGGGKFNSHRHFLNFTPTMLQRSTSDKGRYDTRAESERWQERVHTSNPIVKDKNADGMGRKPFCFFLPIEKECLPNFHPSTILASASLRLALRVNEANCSVLAKVMFYACTWYQQRQR